MESNLFFPEHGGISNNIAFNFEEEGAALADSVAEAKTTVELDTVTVHATGIVIAGGNTAATENVEIPTALRIPVVERVVQRQKEFTGDGTVSVHGDGVIGNAVTSSSSGLVLVRSFVAAGEPSGVVVAEAKISTTVNFLLEDDTGTGIESTAPERLFDTIELFYIGLVIKRDSGTDTPIAPETILRILRNLFLGEDTACKSEHAEQH